MDSFGDASQRRSSASYSRLSQFLRCPLQFYFKRILKLPEPTAGSGLVFGSAIHNALAYIHNQIKVGETIDRDIVIREFLETWHDYRGTEIKYKANESRKSLSEMGARLLDLYLENPISVGIRQVEHNVLVPLMNSRHEYLATPMVSVFDLLTETNGTVTLHEFKTSARKYSCLEVDLSLQATAYANAVYQLYGQIPIVEFVVLTKTKTPKIHRIETYRTEQQLLQFGDLVEKVESAIRNNSFYPNPSPMNCSTCPFREPCKDWEPNPPGKLVQLNGSHAG